MLGSGTTEENKENDLRPPLPQSYAATVARPSTSAASTVPGERMRGTVPDSHSLSLPRCLGTGTLPVPFTPSQPWKVLGTWVEGGLEQPTRLRGQETTNGGIWTSLKHSFSRRKAGVTATLSWGPPSLLGPAPRGHGTQQPGWLLSRPILGFQVILRTAGRSEERSFPNTSLRRDQCVLTMRMSSPL